MLYNILNSIDVFTYTANRLNNDARIGFIANQTDDAITPLSVSINKGSELLRTPKPMNGKTPSTDVEFMTLDYSRLTTILLGAIQHLSERVLAIEHSVNQKAKKTRT